MSQVHLSRRTRALLAAFGAATAILLCLGATVTQAAPARSLPTPSGPMAIEIHKFEQPAQLGLPTDGLEITDPSLLPSTPPVAGAKFSATRVPGIDLTTNTGQHEASALTPEQAAQLIEEASVTPEATDVTDENGNATLSLSGTGLYLVEETLSPVGFVAAAPFLVSLPLTNPRTLDGWLTTVHVYPKNARAAITLDVTDQDAVALGDVVHWRARADIPNQSSITGYVITQKINAGLELVGGANAFSLALDCTGCPSLIEGTDYTRSFDAATGEYVFTFTRDGRSTLGSAVAAHPSATVTVDYDTRVLTEGALRNEATLVVGGSPEAFTDGATTKWGPLGIEVYERSKPSNLIAGAHFQLFLSAADAASGTNPISIEGVSEWVTDANGQIFVHGLRFSDFVNGLDRSRDDLLFRDYFVIMTKVPAGYTGDKVPIQIDVTSTTQPEIARVELKRVGGGGGGGGGNGDLVVTGAQITGLAMLAAFLIGGGLMFMLRRKEHVDQSKTIEQSGRL